jgi:hypothetical protein
MMSPQYQWLSEKLAPVSNGCPISGPPVRVCLGRCRDIAGPRGKTHGRGCARTARGILRAILPAQQVRQLRHVDRDPPRLVFGE